MDNQKNKKKLQFIATLTIHKWKGATPNFIIIINLNTPLNLPQFKKIKKKIDVNA